ncbi:mediator complex subunit 16 [Haematobia irritans]|uniref:mediator complex subunit 16 n=1 Tax=Haematobia irritans TaxID=7368 RepID=UPI003F4FC07C
MTILYKVQNALGTKDGYLLPNCVLCKVSVKNIVAYCVQQNLQSVLSVCDLVLPWKSFLVTTSKNLIATLEWNQTGELLLVGYKHGLCEIWKTRNHEINNWRLIYKSSMPFEEIIQAKFFHNGRQMYFNTHKKDLQAYADKFERSDFRPSLMHFGNTPVEGCFILSSSGLIGAFAIPKLLPPDVGANTPVELNMHTYTSLQLVRSYLTHSYVGYCPSGNFSVVVSCGDEPLINCYKVAVEKENDESLALKCGSLTSVFLQKDDMEGKRISHIRWRSINGEEVLFIVYDYMEGSFLEQWILKKKHQPVHKLLQKNKNDFVQWEEWELAAKLSLTSRVCDVSLTKLPAESILIFATLKDNSVQVLEMGLKKIASTVFERMTEDPQRMPCKLMTSDITFLNQLLVLFDNLGQMYAMQVPSHHYDKNYKMNPLSLPAALLEYSIVTGIDASDVLMLNLPNLEVLSEKITENFTRQHNFTRQYYYSNFLSLKSNLCRIQTKQQDFDNLITLHSISIAFKSLLRPSDMSSQDKGPAENLSMILSDPNPQYNDVDKVLCVLDAKDFTVEPTTLQSLQQLIQWVADLALSILNKLPEEIMKSKFNKKHGYDISRDMIAISSIRELLVMIRIWGLLIPQCLPIYTKSVENFDVLPVLFRLLTRLYQNPNEPDDVLLDDCSVLSTQVLIPSRHSNTPTTLLNSHATAKLFPFVFQTAVEPLALQDLHYEEVVFANSCRDDVSNLHLGSKVKTVRKCIRCGFINNLEIAKNRIAKTSALKAWTAKTAYCHCGGFWLNA